MVDGPKIGEVREFHEHRPMPLTEQGFSRPRLIPLDALLEPASLRMDPVTIKRVWDGAKWAREITP